MSRMWILSLALPLAILATSSSATSLGTHEGGKRHDGHGEGGEKHGGGVLAKPISRLSPDVVVAKLGDGGNVTTIKEALDRFNNTQERRGYFIIYIKKGIYEEHLIISANNVVLVGDGMDSTIITGSMSKGTGHDTENSATLSAKGVGFMARDLGIHNTAGALGDKQAVALFSDSKKSVFYRCDIRGFQDTLFAKQYVQFYRECRIWGTVDFIFGDAAAIFQNCDIYARRPSSKGQHDVITAHGRELHDGSSGFVFQNCTITASPIRGENLTDIQTYLGRPWRHHARAVFMMSSIASIIHADGWVSWNESSEAGGKPPEAGHEKHMYFGEYKNHLLGGNELVHWKGFYEIQNNTEAKQFTPRKFIHGGAWLPWTGVPYYLGLN